MVVNKLFYSTETSGSSSSSETKPSKKFMAMFIGFLDGDGYFDIGEQKQYNKVTKSLVKSTIRIRLATNVHVRDLLLLEYFVKVLGVGSLSPMSGKEQVRLIFSKKDIVTVILPLMKLYNLKFLTYQRTNQFSLLTYILENNIIHWNDVNYVPVPLSFIAISARDLVNLDFFADWSVGFTMAEGSFGIKESGSAFYQVKQSGIDNSELLKAICLMITAREAFSMRPDYQDSYQLSLTSRVDVQKVVDFFSSPNIHPLYGYKLKQFNIWLIALKGTRRYAQIKSSNNNNSNE